jgi:XRE family aerobic/anaerobic benzoate catabolism transcriptional regulator
MHMSDLQPIVGSRIHARRKALGMTVAVLAERSGLSVRYILSAEKGQANLSLRKMGQLCDALDLAITSLVSTAVRGEVDALLMDRSQDELGEVADWLRNRFGLTHKPVVALLGVRGAGKTAVGRELESTFQVGFVELDSSIEVMADLSLAEIFALHGERYYRRMEFDALNGLINDSKRQVVATGGGIVTDERNFTRLSQSTTTIWLKATAEDHWNRVIDQGDRRPMRDHPEAMAQLRTLLAERAPMYAKADFIVDTSQKSVGDIAKEIAQFLGW